MWREHATETARVLNQINPDFIRVRTLTVRPGMPLYDEVKNGKFIRQTDEEIIEEEKLFIENLNCQSNFVSDHITNLLQELEGKLPDDKAKMLATVAKFQALSPEEKQNFRLGRRLGIYERLDELHDSLKHNSVERAIKKLSQNGNPVDEETIYSLMEGFV
jgi:hypothetical protein